ncbi:MAG: site-2 protease family protein [Actinobacteria bacterium]|nr:site-2 protease family protein [Actinomycetota bacterium]
MLAVLTLEQARFALYLAIALIPALVLHEYAHAWAAVRRHDATPRFYGRLSLNPRPLIDPFGSVILPGLILLLWAAGFPLPVFAYGKPMPRNPAALANPDRDTTLIAVSGPVVNLLVAVVAGALFRATGFTGIGEVAAAFVVVNVSFFVFYLMPIPGLDGGTILQRFLPPRPREVFRSGEQYLALWMLLAFFLLGQLLLLPIVRALSNGLCDLLAGGNCL